MAAVLSFRTEILRRAGIRDVRLLKMEMRSQGKRLWWLSWKELEGILY